MPRGNSYPRNRTERASSRPTPLDNHRYISPQASLGRGRYDFLGLFVSRRTGFCAGVLPFWASVVVGVNRLAAVWAVASLPPMPLLAAVDAVVDLSPVGNLDLISTSVEELEQAPRKRTSHGGLDDGH